MDIPSNCTITYSLESSYTCTHGEIFWRIKIIALVVKEKKGKQVSVKKMNHGMLLQRIIINQ